MKRTKSTTFYCFSPFVMVMTVLIELGLLLFAFVSRKKTASTILILLLFGLLALFQVAEYGICEQIGFSSPVWAKMGFVAITMLPIIGLHLIYSIAEEKPVSTLVVAYAMGLSWIGQFIFGGIMEGQVCNGNYVIFDLRDGFGGAYFVYYYFWLFFGSIVALQKTKKVSKEKSKALIAMVAGYATFTVPATLIWFVFEDAARGLPSIMCGFAVIFAIILGFYILPKVSDSKKPL